MRYGIKYSFFYMAGYLFSQKLQPEREEVLWIVTGMTILVMVIAMDVMERLDEINLKRK